MEAIIGQFFTAVGVAWLVGNIITEKGSNILKTEIEE